eukprot:3064494-Prymnesium_polylepis.1
MDCNHGRYVIQVRRGADPDAHEHVVYISKCVVHAAASSPLLTQALCAPGLQPLGLAPPSLFLHDPEG